MNVNGQLTRCIIHTNACGGFFIILTAVSVLAVLGLMALSLNTTSLMRNQQALRKINTVEGYYGTELSAWYFYHREKAGLPHGSNPGSTPGPTPNDGRYLASIENEYDKGVNLSPDLYEPENYTEGLPLNLMATQIYDSSKNIMRRYTGNNLFYRQPSSQTSSYCGEMNFAKGKGFRKTCLYKSASAAPPDTAPKISCKPGKTTTDFGGVAMASSVVVQSDGKIVVAGIAGKGQMGMKSSEGKSPVSEPKFALARYLEDLTLDPSFGGGKIITDVAGGKSELLSDMVIQRINKLEKIVVVGYVEKTNLNDIILVRYNLDGTLDSSFGSGGIVITVFGAEYNDMAFVLVVQKVGEEERLVIGGHSAKKDGDGKSLLIVRYRQDGTLDESFGPQGNAKVFLDGMGHISSIALEPGGKILAMGIFHTDPYTHGKVGWLSSGGILENGHEPTNMENVSNLQHVLAENSTFFATGDSGNQSSLRLGKLIALTRDFKAPPGFGASTGIDLPLFFAVGGGIALQFDGRLILGGSKRGTVLTNSGLLLRYSQTGVQDMTFGPNGNGRSEICFYDTCSGDTINSGFNDMIADRTGSADDRIVAVGNLHFPNGRPNGAKGASAGDFAIACTDRNGKIGP